MTPRLLSALINVLKLECDKLLSIFAFNCNLRHYIQDNKEGLELLNVAIENAGYTGKVGRCRLTQG